MLESEKVFACFISNYLWLTYVDKELIKKQYRRLGLETNYRNEMKMEKSIEIIRKIFENESKV